jgi:hypothetical protein
MHRVLIVAIVAALLAACDRPASPAQAAAPAPPAPIQVPDVEAYGTALVDKAIDDLLGDHAAYRRVFDAFQQAVAARDAKTVATLVAYPFTAWIGGKKKTIADADAFVAQYDDIVTAPVARIIAAQDYGSLFVNDKGVMLGRGEAWIGGTCLDGAACKQVDVRVIAIQPTID